ncbi:MAG TPA: T9SS type A sorting domain-containing protein [Saprospiraceae bacterium]|nr:T9SS type A sorting domain-containing protein [Saprospiraceae bacterium]
MKNSALFIKITCMISSLLIFCMVNLKAQGDITGYTYLGALNGHHYFFSNCGTTWEQANEAAIEMGGYLATISSHEENSFLGYWYWNLAQIPLPEVLWGVWIGLKGEQGVYEWTNGEPFTFNLWYTAGEPEPAHPDGAVLIGDPGVSSYDYYWRSYVTSNLAAYVVEFPFELNCNYPNKSYVCHNGNTICVNTSAVQAHLNHGDFAGPCGPCNSYAMQSFPDEKIESDGRVFVSDKVMFTEEYSISKEFIESDQIHIFPNPASTDIQIMLPLLNREGTLKIITLTGQTIQSHTLHGQQSMMIDLSNYTQGIYLIDVRSANCHYQKKIVKM